MRLAAAATAIVLVAAALAGCGGDGVVGIGDPGPQTTEEREIATVSAVRLSTSGDLVITPGDAALTVTAGEDALPHLDSDVDGDTLVLDTDGTIGSLGEVRYALTLPELTELRVSGSGGVQADGFTGDKLRLEVSGSGNLELGDLTVDRLEVSIQGSGQVDLSGRTDSQSVGVSGSGDYGAVDLVSREASVDVSGSGSVDLDVTERLEVSISGSGDVTYSGDPSVDSAISGSGSVSPR